MNPTASAVRFTAEERFGNWTREGLLSLLACNDPNGCYTDEDTRAEGLEPMTREDALSILQQWQDDDPGADVLAVLKMR